MAGLAALVPKRRVNLTRFHEMFAPNSKLRSQKLLEVLITKNAKWCSWLAGICRSRIKINTTPIDFASGYVEPDKRGQCRQNIDGLD